MGKKFSSLFVILFFCACAIPGLGMLFFGESQAAANEILSPKPVLTQPDGSLNLEVMSDAADYFADHFAFRQELITADSALKVALFHTSSQDQVALGKDGWLFYAETLEDFTGADCLTERQAYSIGRSLALARDYVESKGATFLFTVAPNKISLYPEYAQNGLVPGEITTTSQVKNALTAEKVPYADLFAAFEEQEDVLYHKLDSHWTYRGAALAHDALLDCLGFSGNSFAKEVSYQPTHSGDLYQMLYPASSLLDDQWKFTEELDFTYDTPIRDVDDLRIQTSSDGTFGNLLMFRDSFGNTLHSLMAEDFSHALFSRAQPYNLGLMDEVSANYVIVEIVERNLPLLSQIPFILPAPEVNFSETVQPGDNEVVAQGTQSPSTPNYLTVTGQVSPCDTDSPFYLQVNGVTYELSPVGSATVDQKGYPFTGYLPLETDLSGAQLLYKENGLWFSSPLEVQYGKS
jgi:hypothetical protein